ncbi:MAG: glycosyltransferase [Pseudomonadota bacterium]
MKVLHIITGLNTGGAERALYSVLAGGLTEKIENRIVSLSNLGTMGAPLQKLGVEVDALKMRKSITSLSSIRKLQSIINKYQPDVVQGWMYHGNIAASLSRILSPRNPEISWNIRHSLHDVAREKRTTRYAIQANRWLSPRADAIIYNSKVSLEQHEAFGLSSKQSCVIPNGFDTNQLKPNPKNRNTVRLELGLNLDALVVGHVARFHPMKNHEGFLNSAVEIIDNKPNVQFLLIGRDVTLQHPALSGIIPKSLEPHFVFTDERSDISRLMSAMDTLCMSSSWGEAFPNVLAEAMAIGIPCVATDIGDSAWIIGKTGIVIESANISALNDGLLAMLEKTPKDREELGRLARQRVVSEYSIDQTVDSYFDLYQNLLGTAHR